MNYRKVTKKDIDQLSFLFDKYRVFHNENSDLRKGKEFLNNRIMNEDSEIFVAENSEHSLIGFVQLYPGFSSTKMSKSWRLNDLYVTPEYRKKGVASQLIEMAKELVVQSNACCMYLETWKSNTIGNNLYPKTGFSLNKDSNFYEWNIE